MTTRTNWGYGPDYAHQNWTQRVHRTSTHHDARWMYRKRRDTRALRLTAGLLVLAGLAAFVVAV